MPHSGGGGSHSGGSHSSRHSSGGGSHSRGPSYRASSTPFAGSRTMKRYVTKIGECPITGMQDSSSMMQTAQMRTEKRRAEYAAVLWILK